MKRTDGRTSKQLRTVKMTKDFVIYPEGSVFIEMGNTRVLCNASIEEKVPRFLAGTGKGWVTAEYSLLPRSTQQRNSREADPVPQTTTCSSPLFLASTNSLTF